MADDIDMIVDRVPEDAGQRSPQRSLIEQTAQRAGARAPVPSLDA